MTHPLLRFLAVLACLCLLSPPWTFAATKPDQPDKPNFSGTWLIWGCVVQRTGKPAPAWSAVIMVQLLSVRIFQVVVWVPQRWSVLLSSSCHRACVEKSRESAPLVTVVSIRAVPSEAARGFLAAKNPELDKVKAAIDDVIQDPARAAETIRNVRALFQRDEVEMLAVDLGQILYDVECILRADAASKRVTLQLDVPTGLPAVMGNKTQLIEVVMNLVSNGLDSVCESGEAGTVEIRASQPEAGRVRVLVRDSGKGIEPEALPRLFDAFFTTKPKGMGMGLAIVRSIIENHGGRIWPTCNSDRGATFEFDLPVEADS